ncbi:acyl-CoA thioesterase [Aliikangiella coralliicola]|uniref:Acyl-CoA thioesterase n=1 Tax=Aliikangiella coralliicola TaxID=2592383 RepID=A0A545UGM5_9GAMM|nr:hotdog domain-containing protein [Aliikangiella coralliicola]TQV88634.1 acyl-CoA thioesterase [Aliikangiella coralliicola]
MSIKRKTKQAEQMVNWNLVFPNQANPSGNMFGGDVLAIMDTTAAMAAKRFSEHQVSTVTVEAVHFAKPIMVGDNIKTTAKVVAVGSTSLTVKSDVYRDDGNGGLMKCVSAFLTFVAFDYQRQPTIVPLLELLPEDEKDHKKALIIRESAKKREEMLKQL